MEESEVGEEGRFVGVGTPDCFAPGAEDEVVGGVVVELEAPGLGGVEGAALEPLGGFDGVLAEARKGDDTLGVVASCGVDAG